jgi:hypothetical protein
VEDLRSPAAAGFSIGGEDPACLVALKEAPISPSVHVREGSAHADTVSLPPQVTRPLGTARLLSLALVILMGSLANSLVVVRRHVSAAAFSSAAGPAFHSQFELVSWSFITGSAFKLPCATAFELAAAFAGYVLPAGQPWDLPSPSEIDWGPRVEPVDLSNAAGWERIRAIFRQK